MATFTVTVTNSMNIFGGGPTSKWGDMVWGVDNWGEGDPLYRTVFKVLSNTETFSDTITLKPFKVLSDTFQFATDTLSMVRGLGDYDYVFTGDTTDGDGQVISTYTAVSDNSSTYTTFTTNSATWSSV